MEGLWQFHDWFERTFWNSLTKKLLSFLLLFFVDLVYVGIYLHEKSLIATELKGASVAPEVIARIDGALDGGLVLMVVLTLAALSWNVLQILYLRHLILRPVRIMIEIFNETAKGDGDFSRNLPTITHDELRTLAESYNQFAEKMRRVIGEVRKVSVNISREAVVVKGNVASTAKRAAQQGEIAQSVFGASTESTQAIREVSASADVIAGATETNLLTARKSLAEMNDIVVKVASVSERLATFNDTVTNLGLRSNSIRQIATLIKDIADQTNLLALNAAIEAARAGEQGRGFAVVADEVRKLAERVNVATEEITANISGMTSLVENTQAENSNINEDIKQTRNVVERSSVEFEKMVKDFEETTDQLTHIAAAMEELSATNANVHEAVSQLHQLSAEVATSMKSSEQSTGTLAVATEGVQELVSRFKIGQGAFDFNVNVAREFRDAVQAKMDELRAAGANLWDQNYRPIQGTNPQKYEVGYLRAFEQQVQSILEEYLGKLQGGIYTLVIDTKAYTPIHNLKFSKPLTGDYQTDLVGNRTKRIWEDPTGQRAAKNTESLLVQTYARDTGEILSEINVPIMVEGRIWGNVRVGCDSNTLLKA
jgi:methyl-accepting chemotaxis protein